MPSTLSGHVERRALRHLGDGPVSLRDGVVLPAEHPDEQVALGEVGVAALDHLRGAHPAHHLAEPDGRHVAAVRRSSRCASRDRATGTGCGPGTRLPRLRHGRLAQLEVRRLDHALGSRGQAATDGSLARSSLSCSYSGSGLASRRLRYPSRWGSHSWRPPARSRPSCAAHSGDGESAAAGFPREVVEALVAGGFFRMLVPSSLGGGESDPATFVATVEELARARRRRGLVHRRVRDKRDGRRLHRRGRGARGLRRRRARCRAACSPRAGRATTSRRRLLGHRALGVRERHRPLRLADGRLHGDRERRRRRCSPRGGPTSASMLFPAREVEVIDTWHVSGLRGTGSHDMQVHEVRVPAERTTSLFTRRAARARPAVRVPPVRAARPGDRRASRSGSRARRSTTWSSLRARRRRRSARAGWPSAPATQARVARAEAALRAARELLYAEIERGWAQARAATAR